MIAQGNLSHKHQMLFIYIFGIYCRPSVILSLPDIIIIKTLKAGRENLGQWKTRAVEESSEQDPRDQPAPGDGDDDDDDDADEADYADDADDDDDDDAYDQHATGPPACPRVREGWHARSRRQGRGGEGPPRPWVAPRT